MARKRKPKIQDVVSITATGKIYSIEVIDGRTVYGVECKNPRGVLVRTLHDEDSVR